MDLVLWRHAEAEPAEEGMEDLARPLTSRGEKQAARMAVWLDRQLPDGLRVLCSPALRAEQTAKALGRKYKLRAELLPDGTPAELLTLVQWPQARGTMVVVGHQPVLGQTASLLLGLEGQCCTIRKAGLWWLRQRARNDKTETVLMAVMSPEFL
jgi:phosphohistidine phosphatase